MAIVEVITVPKKEDSFLVSDSVCLFLVLSRIICLIKEQQRIKQYENV